MIKKNVYWNEAKLSFLLNSFSFNVFVWKCRKCLILPKWKGKRKEEIFPTGLITDVISCFADYFPSGFFSSLFYKSVSRLNFIIFHFLCVFFFRTSFFTSPLICCTIQRYLYIYSIYTAKILSLNGSFKHNKIIRNKKERRRAKGNKKPFHLHNYLRNYSTSFFFFF